MQDPKKLGRSPHGDFCKPCMAELISVSKPISMVHTNINRLVATYISDIQYNWVLHLPDHYNELSFTETIVSYSV
jgi:hypothetical protein